MTDNEIIKAFEACYTNKYTDCDECPYYCRKENRCVDMIVDGVPTLPKNILDLINRLKAENERLTARNFELSEKGEKVCVALKNAKSEARKEFAEFLKARKIIADTSNYYGKECITDVITVEDIDNLLKEMG